MVSNAEGPAERVRTVFYLFRLRYEATPEAAGIELAREPAGNRLCAQVMAEVRTELASPSNSLGMAGQRDADAREYLQTMLAAYDERTSPPGAHMA